MLGFRNINVYYTEPWQRREDTDQVATYCTILGVTKLIFKSIY